MFRNSIWQVQNYKWLPHFFLLETLYILWTELFCQLIWRQGDFLIMLPLGHTKYTFTGKCCFILLYQTEKPGSLLSAVSTCGSKVPATRPLAQFLLRELPAAGAWCLPSHQFSSLSAVYLGLPIPWQFANPRAAGEC